MFFTLESVRLFFGKWVKKPNNNIGKSSPKSSIAVLIIDMQEYFLEDLVKEKVGRMVKSQKEVIDYCAEHDIPVVVIEYRGCGKTIKPLMGHVKKVPRREFVTKNFDNGFHEPDLKEILDEWGVGKIMLMGVNASACVIDTAEGGIENGFEIATSESLIEDDSETDKNLPWYKKNGIYKEDHLELIKTLNTI